MKKIIIGWWRCIIADIIYIFVKEYIKSDIDRFLKYNSFGKKHSNKLICLNYLLLNEYPFRSVFYYRINHQKNIFVRCLAIISKIFIANCNTVEIAGEIDEGLLISHNFCVVRPKKAGKNLRIGPGVVIGRSGKNFPTIGDNVYIASNSTVIGGIHIGNNVIIGAGSVVTKDIPDNSVYVGNPAHFIKNIDDRLKTEII